LWVPDADYLAGMLCAELNDGMPLPGMTRSRARAGFVVCGCDPEGLSEIEELGVRAAAIAARREGAPLRLQGGPHARRLYELAAAERLPAGRMVFGHCDDARFLDGETELELASKGAYIAYDHIGWEEGAAHAMPDEERVQSVKNLVASGYAERVLLGCGTVGCGLGVPSSRHGCAYLLKEFVPRLEKAGVGAAALHTLLAENPRRLFAGER
jgi:phosphotriesterase-related protein